jgi:hypothetical protein
VTDLVFFCVGAACHFVGAWALADLAFGDWR